MKGKASVSKQEKSKQVKARVHSRASPPPKDDFEDEAHVDAAEYAEEQRIELQRRLAREENAERRKRGLPPIRLPGAGKLDRLSRLKHRSGFDPEDELDGFERGNVFERVVIDPRDLLYEGQVILPFNPLEEMVQMEPGGELSIERVRQRRMAEKTKAVPGRGTSNDFLKFPTGTTKQRTKQEVKAEPREEVKSEPPDIKPDTSDKVKTEPADVKPSIDAQISVKAEPSGDVKPTSKELEPDVTPDVRREVDGDEESEEEDYGEDDMAIAPWGRAAKPEADDDESEEEYPEDEYYSSSQHPSSKGSQSQAQSQPKATSSKPLLATTSSQLLAPAERPAFPCTPEQLEIGPHPLDPDDPKISIPASINRFLRAYQRAGTEFFYNKYKYGYGGILGDDMGLGKTVQVISFLSAIMRKTGTSLDERRRKNSIRASGQNIAPQTWPTALIVCPTSLVHNWKQELETWGYFEFEILQSGQHKDTLTAMKNGFLDIVLVSFELCVKFADDLKAISFSVVIVDEAHKIKNPTGFLALGVKRLRARSCFALTGTLIQNRMEEMWSVLDFVHRGWAGTYKQWKEYAARPVTRGHRRDGTVKEVCLAIKRVGELRDKILPHLYLRRDKTLIADELPVKRDLVVLCPLGKRQGAVYQRVIDSEDVAFILRAKEQCECGSGMRRKDCHHPVNSQGDEFQEALLKMFHALGQCANHLALLYTNQDDPAETRAVKRRIFELCVGEPFDPSIHNKVEAALDPDNCGKWNLLKNLLLDWRARREENNKVLIFSNSVRLLKMILEFIETAEGLSGFGCELFAGEVDKDERAEIVKRFQDPKLDQYIMLVSTVAGGVGLNLTAANKVVIFDPSWNPANDLQAMDRAFRIGQNRPVDVYRLIGKGTIEELMYERQIYKQQRARQMNQGTFERRTHAGYEGAKQRADKGELFGVHNMFRYNPNGYVQGNLERIQLVEDQLRHDFIAAEYAAESDEEDDDGDDKVLNARRARDQRKAALAIANEEDRLMSELMSDGQRSLSKSGDVDILSRLGINPMEHEKAFRDSPEERKLYEMGLEMLKDRPELAHALANDIVRLQPKEPRGAKRPRPSDDRKDRKGEVDEEPWQKRFAAGKGRNQGKLLVDSDEDD